MTIIGDQVPTIFSSKQDLKFCVHIEASDLKAKTKAFIFELTKDLKHSGCRLIGHIKGLVNAGNNGYLMFSITSFKEGARFKGKIVDRVEYATITINVIVYAIEQKIVKTLYQKAFNKHFG